MTADAHGVLFAKRRGVVPEAVIRECERERESMRGHMKRARLCGGAFVHARRGRD